jgi:hypothetical protein
VVGRFLAAAAAAAAAAPLAGCGPPPPLTPQEILRDTNEPVAVRHSGGWQPGAEVTFGDVAVRIESVERGASGRDLTKESVGEALALIAAGAQSAEALAEDVRAAAAIAASAEPRAKIEGRGLQVSVSIEGDAASERVRKQATAVESGARTVARTAALVAGTAELLRSLQAIAGTSDTVLHLAADSRGVPHRSTCSVRERGFGDKRPNLSCTIVRADRPPTIVWHLNVNTSANLASAGMIVQASRGWLRPEPAVQGEPPIWISRPDTTIPWSRRSYLDYASFAIHRESTAVARLTVATDLGPTQAWLAPGTTGLDESARHALDVAIAVLALVPWPEVEKHTDEPR